MKDCGHHRGVFGGFSRAQSGRFREKAGILHFQYERLLRRREETLIPHCNGIRCVRPDLHHEPALGGPRDHPLSLANRPQEMMFGGEQGKHRTAHPQDQTRPLMSFHSGPATRPPRLPQAGRAELADAGRAAAGRAGRADAPAGAIDHPPLAGRRPEPARDVRPAPGHPDRRRDQGDRDGGPGHPARPGVRAAGRPDGLGRPDPVDGEQGGGPRARHVPDEDGLSARPDGRASLDRRDLLPRAAGGPDGHPAAHLDPDRPMAEPGRVPRGRVRRVPGGRPQGTPARRDSAGVPGLRDAARVRRPGGRRAGLRPGAARPRRGDPAPRDARPRPRR